MPPAVPEAALLITLYHFSASAELWALNCSSWLMAHGHGTADLALGGVFTLDIEFLTTDSANSAVWKIQ